MLSQKPHHDTILVADTSGQSSIYTNEPTLDMWSNASQTSTAILLLCLHSVLAEWFLKLYEWQQLLERAYSYYVLFDGPKCIKIPLINFWQGTSWLPHEAG